MKLKYKLIRLKNRIVENIDTLSKEFDIVYDILDEIKRMILWDIEHSLILQWWVKNEHHIDTINKIVERNKIR